MRSTTSSCNPLLATVKANKHLSLAEKAHTRASVGVDVPLRITTSVYTVQVNKHLGLAEKNKIRRGVYWDSFQGLIGKPSFSLLGRGETACSDGNQN